jgi:2-hydroxy-6-oxonona-2,4-dienedioate hydrolase
MSFPQQTNQGNVHTRIWSGLGEQGWPDRSWIGETLKSGDTTWFARIDPVGNPGLPPIVMIHGLVVSGAYFRPVAMYLDNDLSLYIPDLPGFGHSETDGSIWTLDQHADGLAAWMIAHGLSDAVMIGNSLGCQLLTLLAVRYPELVHSLILIAPTVDPDESSVPQIAWRAILDIPRENPSIWSIWIPDFLRAGPMRAIRSLNSGLRDPQTYRLDDIRQPVLVIGGERDPIISPEWVHEMAALIPRGEAMILPGASHAMNYSDPEALAEVIHRAVGQAGRVRQDG